MCTVLVVLIVILWAAVALPGQDKGADGSQSKQSSNVVKLIPYGLAFAGLIFGLYQYLRRNKIEEQKRSAIHKADDDHEVKKQLDALSIAESIYRAALKEELGSLHTLGSPDMETPAVTLEDVFVSLRISEQWRSDHRFEGDENEKEMRREFERERHLSPEEVMERAFQKYRLLLIIGDPGSGKTTLLKFYSMCCLDRYNKRYRELGFDNDILPLYFPLRELEFNDKEIPASLPESLAGWSERHLLNIPKETFLKWLHERETLVLLDGLDEVSSKERRKKVCRWVKETCAGLGNARFALTSRATGYRKLDGIELAVPHLRADIMDFSLQQQEEFLERWFRAVYLHGLPPKDMEEKEWRQKQLKTADQRSGKIIEFLNKEDNKAVRELSAVPMLLQIVAIIWKDRKHLPRSRPALYDAALNYLLDYRDQEKDIEPLLPFEEARRVLAPTALWMQEELEKDEAPKEGMHQTMQPILETLGGGLHAKEFCIHLRDRAGLIADYDRDHYVFRHKSFREFLAGLQLLKTSHQEDCIKKLIGHFNDDWWEEPIRFFMNRSDDEIFDRFMVFFFKSPISHRLDAHHQTLLRNLVLEAPQKKVDALKECLDGDSLNDNQRRYVMDCLKLIGTPKALQAIEEADKTKWKKGNRSYAEDITTESEPVIITENQKPPVKSLEFPIHSGQDSFRNPFEGNVEYIKIPGATYKYSVSKKEETVPDLYFCKYPVTNQRYRRFIDYLSGKLKEYEKQLSIDAFAEKLLEFSKSIKGYADYLGGNPREWPDKFRSTYHDNKKFNADDQPVVRINWYSARAYCFWLSCLEPGSLYRLPMETEWEWAAGGNPDGSIREYPWPKEKGNPTPELANYGGNVGATTPVGRYPDGATPAGLMDMAGNIWEWMENYYDKDEDSFALQGGSWDINTTVLRCSARDLSLPRSRW
ncbi:MAG: SUMF1/EgtB/PvdO family nonheme iron enzyme, partial [bacterium]|nr:SUMF1/EgtB/PvdO family nonheme iron enzyme [bacterium]